MASAHITARANHRASCDRQGPRKYSPTVSWAAKTSRLGGHTDSHKDVTSSNTEDLPERVSNNLTAQTHTLPRNSKATRIFAADASNFKLKLPGGIYIAAFQQPSPHKLYSIRFWDVCLITAIEDSLLSICSMTIRLT